LRKLPIKNAFVRKKVLEKNTAQDVTVRNTSKDVSARNATKHVPARKAFKIEHANENASKDVAVIKEFKEFGKDCI
jgi:hypothetical protein